MRFALAPALGHRRRSLESSESVAFDPWRPPHAIAAWASPLRSASRRRQSLARVAATGASRFSTGPSGASPATNRSTAKPSGISAASSTSNTVPRAGVMLGAAISALVRSAVRTREDQGRRRWPLTCVLIPMMKIAGSPYRHRLTNKCIAKPTSTVPTPLAVDALTSPTPSI